MEDQSPRRRPSLGMIMALAAIALTAGSATAFLTWRSLAPSLPNADFPEIEIDGEAVPEGYEAPDSDSITVPNLPDADVAANPKTQAGTVYWVATEGTEVALAPAAIDLPHQGQPAELLAIAFGNLMTGPQSDLPAATSIPPNTELLALTVEPDGIHVDLSEEFTAGGGSASMIGRLSQVVYTATTLDPNAPVWLAVAGEPLRLLGGEGLEVRYPITRSDLATDFGVQNPPAN